MAIDIDFAALPELDLEAHERALVVEALRRSRSVPEAADLLRLSRFALRRRLEKFGLPTDPYRLRKSDRPQMKAAPAPEPTAPALPPGIRLPPKRTRPKAKAAVLSAALALSGCDQGRPAELPAGGIFITGAEDDAGSTSGGSTSAGSSSGEADGSGSSGDIPPVPLATSGEDASTSSTSSSSTGEASTSSSTGDASTGSTGDASTSSSSSSTGDGSSSTGDEPGTGCPCAPGIDNFCDLPPGTCPPTAPGGYCDPNGDGAYLDGDFTAGFLDWKAECG